MNILTNHIGYEPNSFKKALVDAEHNLEGVPFSIINIEEEQVLTGKISNIGKVDNWKDYNFALIDFSELKKTGEFYIEFQFNDKTYKSENFLVEKRLFDRSTISDLIYHFKTQRCTDRYDKTDCSVPFYGEREGTADVHGGWYDASGDFSKYFTHLSYANFYNPQQTPMVVWNLLETFDFLNNDNQQDRIKFLLKRVIDEAIHGADFLVRMNDDAGYFYQIVFDVWSKDLEKREICSYSTQKGIKSEKYQAGYRHGAGVAIAALAKMSTYDDIIGDYSNKEYLDTAIKAFDHLEKHNLEYLNDGKENIIDDYCALLGATELYKATKDDKHYEAAQNRAESLMSRIISNEKYQNFWRLTDTEDRPYAHAAEAGLPLISLIKFSEIAKEDKKAEVLDAIKKSIEFELATTSEVANPFGYARQIVKGTNDEKMRSAFFMAHQNETGYWWQGENARISSLSSAMSYANKIINDNDLSDKIRKYAVDQIDWILGLNPFNACMMHGKGRNNYEYLDIVPNAPGGVCNGATAGYDDEHDIAFVPEDYKDDILNNWRWSEQWIPHAGWFILAVAAYSINCSE